MNWKMYLILLLFVVLFIIMNVLINNYVKERDAKIANIEYTLEHKDKVYHNAKIYSYGNNSFILEDGTIVIFGNDSYTRKPE